MYLAGLVHQQASGIVARHLVPMSMPQDNKAADSPCRTLFRPASRAFYREILGVRVRVNLIPLIKSSKSCQTCSF